MSEREREDDEIIAKVRALPQPSMPPSVADAIAEALAREPMPRPSAWTRVRAWIVRPVVGVGVALAAAGAIALWVATRPAPVDDAPVVVVKTGTDAGATREAPPLFGDEPATAGELADLDGFDDRALDVLDDALAAELDDDDVPPTAASADDGLIPDPDLGWVDDLSPADVDSLDHYLDQHRSPT